MPASGTACPYAAHWMGESKAAAPPIPPPAPPSPSPPTPTPSKAVTRKQGFSGFTGHYVSCDDARGAGMGDTW